MPEGMNRQRGRPAATQVHGSDRITKIYGCATMWHENFDEMIEMLKSIFRIDKVSLVFKAFYKGFQNYEILSGNFDEIFKMLVYLIMRSKVCYLEGNF
jgi:hypothetical protein